MENSSLWERFWNFVFKNIIVEVVVAVVAGIVVAIIVGEGRFAIPATPTPLISSTASVANLTSTPIEIPTESIKRGNVLFAENFESGTTNKFRDISGLWRIVKDETGNWVYEINNKGKQDWSSVMFGTNEWQDYIIEYRVRLVDFGPSPYTLMGAVFRNSSFDNMALAHYHVSFAPNDNGLWIQYSDDSRNDYRMLASTIYRIKVGNWYEVRVEVVGPLIKVFIDNNEELEVSDSSLISGPLGLQVGPNLHVQYDDIVITEISK